MTQASSPSQAEAQPGPLSGFRVLDFTSIMSGPFCTRLLADMGAEIIKVEPPGGEHSRFRPPFHGEESVHYAHLNCGKRHIVLDLKSAAGRKAAKDLAMKSDVVVENWRPGVAARLGLDYKALAAIKPDIIYCSISGYGQEGPSSQKAAYASIVEAASGFAHAQMEINGTPQPPTSGTFLGDSLTALWSFSGIQTAIIQRLRTGRGQYLDVSMLESMMFMLVNETHAAQEGPFLRRLHLPLKTTDGYVVVPPISGANWNALARATGHPEWIDDPRFNSVDARNKNWFEMLRLTETWTSRHSMAECEAILLPAGVPISPFRTLREALDDPQLKAREALTPVEVGGKPYLVPNMPFLTPGTNSRPRAFVGAVNADFEAVLGGILGYTGEQMAACRAEGGGGHD